MQYDGSSNAHLQYVPSVKDGKSRSLHEKDSAPDQSDYGYSNNTLSSDNIDVSPAAKVDADQILYHVVRSSGQRNHLIDTFQSGSTRSTAKGTIIWSLLIYVTSPTSFRSLVTIWRIDFCRARSAPLELFRNAQPACGRCRDIQSSRQTFTPRTQTFQDPQIE